MLAEVPRPSASMVRFHALMKESDHITRSPGDSTCAGRDAPCRPGGLSPRQGTRAQGIRRWSLRRARDVGLAKTHLQHVITAVALNMVRLGAWWLGMPPAKTRGSPFATLRGAAA
jgi:hypothetical protein